MKAAELGDEDASVRLVTDAQWHLVLDQAAMVMVEFFDDLEKLAHGKPFSTTEMGAMLPRRYTLNYDLFFARQLAISAAVVGYKLARSPELTFAQTPSSVAEELVTWHILQRAIEVTHNQEDHDALEALEDALFQDTDFLFLYDGGTDGIQASMLGKWLGVGNLDFAEWFLPFTNAADRPHPSLAPASEN